MLSGLVFARDQGAVVYSGKHQPGEQERLPSLLLPRLRGNASQLAEVVEFSAWRQTNLQLGRWFLPTKRNTLRL